MKSMHVRLNKESHRAVADLSTKTKRSMCEIASLAADRLVADVKAGRVSLGITINDGRKVAAK